MKLLRIGLVALLVTSLSSAAFADDLQASAARAASKAVEEQGAMPAAGSGAAKTTMLLGSALFIGGFAVGVYGFLNNQNGKYAEFGEASARNVHLGAAGLGTAFAGGVIMLMGNHARHMPDISTGAHRVSVTKRLSW